MCKLVAIGPVARLFELRAARRGTQCASPTLSGYEHLVRAELVVNVADCSDTDARPLIALSTAGASGYGTLASRCPSQRQTASPSSSSKPASRYPGVAAALCSSREQSAV